MSNITEIDRCNLRRLLGLSSGYVLGNYFSRNRFREFIMRHTGIDVYSDKYAEYSSMGKKLEAFWNLECDEHVGKVNEELLKILENQLQNNDCSQISYIDKYDIVEISQCLDDMLSHALYLQAKGVDVPAAKGETWESLYADIRARLAENKPEFVVDRLHTFATKYLMDLTKEWGIKVPNTSDKLQDYAGAINRFLSEFKLVESSFSRKVISMCAKLLTEYSELRNNKSYAHVNEILTHDEAILAVKTVWWLPVFDSWRPSLIRADRG